MPGILAYFHRIFVTWIENISLQTYPGLFLSSVQSTYWGPKKLAAIFQTKFVNLFSSMKIYEFRLSFHWNLFLRINNIPHCFRSWPGARQATSHYLSQWWLVYWRIFASLGLNDLTNADINNVKKNVCKYSVTATLLSPVVVTNGQSQWHHVSFMAPHLDCLLKRISMQTTVSSSNSVLHYRLLVILTCRIPLPNGRVIVKALTCNDAIMTADVHNLGYTKARGLWKRLISDNKIHGANMGPSGSDRTQVGPMLAPWNRTQVGPMLAPWTLFSGMLTRTYRPGAPFTDMV